MDFTGPAFPLQDGDISIIAGYLGCEIATVRAVLEVEAAGNGFDSKGRPKMLFEGHVFWRELGPGRKRAEAEAQNLAWPRWRGAPYPNDSYPRLLQAMAIDETCALRSASFGLGQVMGFNYKAAGFETVQQFVRAMTYSEGAHLYAMARFIVSNYLQRHLRNKDWEAFARGYNGAGYATHGYHKKLGAAYSRRPAAEMVTPPPASEGELNQLLGLGVPPTPTPRPTPEPAPPDGHGNTVAKVIMAIAAAAAAFAAWWFGLR